MTDAKRWSVYLLECRNGALYCGIALDVAERFERHRQGKGARYTRANPPLRILAQRLVGGRAEALRLEARIKRLPAAQKLAFLLAEAATPA